MTIFTFLATDQSLETVSNGYRASLGEVVRQFSDKQGAHEYTLHDDSLVTLSMPEKGETPEKFALLQEKWIAFYQNRETVHTEIQKNLLVQIEKWNTIVEISFQETENEDRTACIFGSALETAENLKGFILTEDYTLYDSQADIVLDEDGYSDLDEFEPY